MGAIIDSLYSALSRNPAPKNASIILLGYKKFEETLMQQTDLLLPFLNLSEGEKNTQCL
jgi:hypothetical protein